MSILLTTLGASMIATSAIGIHRNMPSTHLKIQVRRYLEANGLEAVKIRNFNDIGEAYRMELSLPYTILAEEVKEHVPGLEQVTSTFIRFSYAGGPIITLDFGYSSFGARMPFRLPVKPLGPLRVPLHSPFGMKMLDFNDEVCCHMLIGGTTRMGKTVFIRLLATMLVHTTQGNVILKMLDNKVNDLYFFRGVRNVEIGESADEAKIILRKAIRETERRKQVLKDAGDCVDMREYRKKHPESVELPYFIIIDEYGRYADDAEIQDLVIQLVETAGYLDMHVIIASQRPDAQTVLRPRIKANLLTRICFTTADKKNSEVILDLPDAFHLNRIQGRAILSDGFPEVIQVPYLTAAQATDMLKPYKELIGYERNNRTIQQGHHDSENVKTLQGFKPRPIGEDYLQEPAKLSTNRKSRAKKART